MIPNVESISPLVGQMVTVELTPFNRVRSYNFVGELVSVADGRLRLIVNGERVSVPIREVRSLYLLH